MTHPCCQTSYIMYMHNNTFKKRGTQSWRDCSAVKNTSCSRRSSRFGSRHLYGGLQARYSSSRGSEALLWPPHILHAVMYIQTCRHTHKNKILCGGILFRSLSSLFFPFFLCPSPSSLSPLSMASFLRSKRMILGKKARSGGTCL